MLDRVADYAERYAEEVEQDRRFAHALMAHHGVPPQIIADDEGFWEYIREHLRAFRADVRLADGDRVHAGGRSLRVVARPGHSTTDTLFVDDRDGLAFAGDHLLAAISSNTEIYAAERSPDGQARSRRALPGEPRAHGADAAATAADRPRPARDRARGAGARPACATTPVAASASSPSSRTGPPRRSRSRAACGPADTVREQPLLVVWEVLGHMELLLAAGLAVERIGDGMSVFELGDDSRRCAPGARPPLSRRQLHRRLPRDCIERS